MPLVSCPGCGHPVANVAPECPRCTRAYPGRPTLPGEAGAGTRPVPAKRPVNGWLIAVTVVGVFIVVTGVSAAIMIPRLAGLVPTGQAEADALLTRAYQAEVAHHGGAGGYTADLAGLGVPRGGFFALSVSRATERELCIEATPLPALAGMELEPRSMDESGWLHESPGCQDQVDLDDSTVTGPGSAAAPPSPR